MTYQWNFDIIWQFREAFLHGAVVTLELTAITIVLGSVVGVVLALARLSNHTWVRWPAIGVIELLRGLPLLVLLVWIYFCAPILLGIRITAFQTAIVAMSLNLSAFAAETFRAGIQAIPPGYIEAARSLGLSVGQTMYRVILPQATRAMLPALVGLYVTMLKLSSLASVIAVVELLHVTNTAISQTYRPLELYTAVAAVYLMLVLPGVFLSSRLETGALFRRSLEEDSVV